LVVVVAALNHGLGLERSDEQLDTRKSAVCTPSLLL
jgi:hypothetical protein